MSRSALELLDELLELDPAERERRLQRVEAQDAALAAQVRDWLAADARSDARVDRPLVRVHDAAAHAPAAAGERIGAWRLERELGRGGMGEVWLAVRDDGEFHQRVALKLVRGDIAGAQAQARFRREREILARLEHPHIARLLDGGALPDGRAWFALELVDGEPITAWCEARGAPLRQRIELMLQVCAAVEHAHRNLVVHRDLKPRNILVDAEGRVHLLDFGIARALAEGEGGDTRLMTPEYAAPEQLQGGPLTTAADVHALGLVLYELLAGVHPFGAGRDTPFQVARGIAERVAPRLPLGGDLAAIVARCLEKSPAQRYPGAGALAEDLQRHLARRPVRARGGRAYRAGRFLRRHAVASGAALAIALALGAAALIGTQQARIAQREAERARHEAATATAVKQFLLDAFRSADPYETGGRTVSARELLESGAARVDAALADAPRVRAELHAAFGDTFAKLDRIAQARASYERALAAWREAGLGDSPEALAAQAGLLLARYEAADFAGLDGELRALLSRYEQAGLQRAEGYLETWSQLVFVLWSQGRYTQASDAAHDFAAQAVRLRGAQDGAAGFAWYTQALIEMDRGRWLAAAQAIERFLPIDRAGAAPGHPGLVTDVQLIARLLEALGDHDAAWPLAQAAHAARLAHFGSSHRLSASAQARVASLRAARGDYAGARGEFEAALAQLTALVGDDHDDVAALRETFAEAAARAADAATARAQRLRAIAVWRRVGGAEHPRVWAGAVALAALGGDDAARRARSRPRLLAILVAQRERDDGGLPDTLELLADWARRDGDAAAARAYRDEAVAVRAQRSGGGTALALARSLAAQAPALLAPQ